MNFPAFLFIFLAIAGGVALFAIGKKIFAIIAIVFFIVAAFFAQTLVIVDAGEVGIQILFGKVIKPTLYEGLHIKNPLARVVTYSIRLQEYTMSVVQGEGDRYHADPITARTSDNSEITIDVTIWWKVNPDSAGYIYSRVSDNMDRLRDLIIRPATRAVIRDVFSKYKLDDCFRNRSEIRQMLYDTLAFRLHTKGILVDDVLLRDLRPPQTVDQAIQLKLAAEQQLQQRYYEIEIARQDSIKRVVEAGGIAASQEIITSQLSAIYNQWNAIEAIREMSKSGNNTIVVIPTSPEGTGIPLILNTDNQ